MPRIWVLLALTGPRNSHIPGLTVKYMFLTPWRAPIHSRSWFSSRLGTNVSDSTRAPTPSGVIAVRMIGADPLYRLRKEMLASVSGSGERAPEATNPDARSIVLVGGSG